MKMQLEVERLQDMEDNVQSASYASGDTACRRAAAFYTHSVILYDVHIIKQ